jgi:hypothetical protein
MSTKVAKQVKPSQKTVAAKPVSKVIETSTKSATKSTKNGVKTAKIGSIRLSEEDKKADTINYIMNTNTNNYVKRDTPLGKTFVNAEKNGVEVPKAMTEVERIVLFVETFKNQLDLKDSVIKNTLKSISDKFPRDFPVVWGGKKRPVRSVDHPKQTSNAYIFFTSANRKSVADANPELSNTEIVSMMAKMWGKTSEIDRAKYHAEAAVDKERYVAEMKVFEADHPDLARAKSSPGKPTKSTAYHKYCEVYREILKEENPDMDGKEITSLLADNWKKDTDQHAKYQELADESNEGFEERVAEYYETDSPKNLSESEQKKADDPENYELNTKTGRYVRKDKMPSPKADKKTKSKPILAAPKPAKVKDEVKDEVNEEVKNEEVKDVSEEEVKTSKTKKRVPRKAVASAETEKVDVNEDAEP